MTPIENRKKYNLLKSSKNTHSSKAIYCAYVCRWLCNMNFVMSVSLLLPLTKGVSLIVGYCTVANGSFN